MLDLYSEIKEIENSKGEDYIEEDIERLIKSKRIAVEEAIYKKFLKNVLNRIKADINIRNYKVYFIGGSIMLKEYIEGNTPAVVPIEAEYANVEGAYKLCDLIWKGNKVDE